MNVINDIAASLADFFATGIGAVVKALFLLIIAVIAATIVKNLVIRLLSLGRIGAFFAKFDEDKEKGGQTVHYIGRFVYLLVFLLFIPGIFGALGAENVAYPILGMLNTVWGYVPNILAAGLILAVGGFIARMVRQLLIPLFRKLRIDKLQERAGIEVQDTERLSNTLAYIVYVLILIPIIIVSLQALKIEAISAPAVAALETVFAFIPNIIVALLIVVIGCLVARFIGQIITRLLGATGMDAKIREAAGREGDRLIPSRLLGLAAEVVLIVFFVVEGMSILKLEVLTGIGAAIIAYLPNVLASLMLIAAALFLARVAEKALLRHGLRSYAVICKIAILVVGAFMVLNQLGIATAIVNSAFILAMAALAVAFAIAFGIGGRSFAARTLDSLTKKPEGTDEEGADEEVTGEETEDRP